jgi:hypothetical protein
MWHKNSSGPNNVACCKPESTWALSECSPSTTTLSERFCRNDDRMCQIPSQTLCRRLPLIVDWNHIEDSVVCATTVEGFSSA